MKKRYNDFNTYFRTIYGGRVHKITVDAGFTCPNRDGKISTGGCIYCNPQGSGTGAFQKGVPITEQLERGSRRVIKRYKTDRFIAYFQAYTNTYAPLERLKQVYDEALRFKGVIGLAVGTRPDCIDNDILDLFENYARDYLVWLEYGLQSAHDTTLALINRGHDFNCFRDAVDMAKGRGIKLCAHVILGLPQETREMMMETADILADLGVDGVKLHLLYVIRGTPLHALYEKGDYRCLEKHEYAELVCDFLERLPHHVIIQRITGDPHPAELVAPMWALEKKSVVDLIHHMLDVRDTFQGKFALRR
ncbi:MAG: TIGR01212 family radical SAM protein [Proteobacteria bacterium]|nr:TIGR01212 family radical SAM protein [Pseudomonadota bacterium]